MTRLEWAAKSYWEELFRRFVAIVPFTESLHFDLFSKAWMRPLILKVPLDGCETSDDMLCHDMVRYGVLERSSSVV